MNKIFDKWNKIKKSLEARENFPNCKTREVWWCHIGKNIGVEQGCAEDTFARPVLVLRVFNEKKFLGLPLTSSEPEIKETKPHLYYDVRAISKLEGFIALTQMKTFSNKRLKRKIIRIEKEIMDEIRERIINLL